MSRHSSGKKRVFVMLSEHIYYKLYIQCPKPLQTCSGSSFRQINSYFVQILRTKNHYR